MNTETNNKMKIKLTSIKSIGFIHELYNYVQIAGSNRKETTPRQQRIKFKNKNKVSLSESGTQNRLGGSKLYQILAIKKAL